jgi:hypothetical protein
MSVLKLTTKRKPRFKEPVVDLTPEEIALIEEGEASGDPIPFEEVLAELRAMSIANRVKPGSSTRAPKRGRGVGASTRNTKPASRRPRSSR